ncbi:tetratricopeptide repeat protein [Maribacter antarcticus]|uniref:tetratricopeptide repeat protein n=1 Tax=Maribacter antarcticus TaxID=505250 RepID=UPI00047B54E0|nr:tetratricopeptide repeat protein [Maribacter antarcticus]
MQRIRLVFLVFLASNLNAQKPRIGIADSLYATGSYAKAINAYASLGTTSAGLQIARAYRAIGNYEKALLQYETIVKESPALQIASFELGKLLLKVKDYDVARKLFSKLVAINNQNPEYHYYLGEVYRELEQPASSLVAYKNAIEIDSTHLRSLFQLGKYFTIKQERDTALRYVDTGLRFYEKDVSLINLKALIYYNDGRFEKAIPWLEKVLALGEQKEYVYEKLAHSYYKEWEFESAKETYTELLKFNDSNSDYYYALAETYRKNKQMDSAALFIRKGMDIQRPVLAKGFMALSVLAREKDDLKLALDYLQLAVKEDPNDGMLFFRLCTLIDRYYKDPDLKLKYFESYIARFGTKVPYFSMMAKKRISELNEEIHYAKESTD